MLRAVKVRLLPTKEQEQLLNRNCGAKRVIYNLSKEVSEKYYARYGKTLKQAAMQRYITHLKKRPKYEWLKAVSAETIKFACGDYFEARKRSFKNLGHGYKTRFKSKRDIKQGFYSRHDTTKIHDMGVYLPSVGIVKTSRQLPEKTKLSNPRVKFDGIYWTLSVGIEVEREPKILTVESIGVDVGIKELCVTSNGIRKENINKTPKLRKLYRRKKKYQRQMSKRYIKGKKKQSSNYEKARKKKAKIERKIANINLNHKHQASTEIVRTKPWRIVCEDIAISNLMKNKKLAPSLQKVGIYEFIRQLKYKSENYGIEFVQANRFFPSSKRCSCCGYVYDNKDYSKQWSLAIREWECIKCKTVHDRDVNASKNLANWSK